MARKDFIDWVERQGLRLRKRLSLSTYDPMEPERLAQRMKVPLFTPDDVVSLPEEIRVSLLTSAKHDWSAGTMIGPDGAPFIIYNPTHSKTRLRATLMEELVHLDLNHKPSEFIQFNGVAFRTHRQTVETQAYWVGSAALVPRHVLQISVEKKIRREYVAEKFFVSTELVKFREKVTGLRLVH